MPRQTNGQYQQPANTAAVSNTPISSTAFNTLITDIGTELTNSLDRNGRSAMQAALPMGNNQITGLADPTSAQAGATKNYVDTSVANFFSTGDVKLTLKSVADPGWLLFLDQTFGSLASGSSAASDDNQALFTLIFNSVSDADAPIFTSSGAASTRAAQGLAATAWAANCRMLLLRALGRAIAIAGAGAGLSGRALGSSAGEETHTLSAGEIPTITANANLTVNPNSDTLLGGNGPTITTTLGPGPSTFGVLPNGTAYHLVTANATGSISSNNTGGQPHNNIPPSVYLNAMVKK